MPLNWNRVLLCPESGTIMPLNWNRVLLGPGSGTIMPLNWNFVGLLLLAGVALTP